MWPLALMLCADRVPIKNAHLEVRLPKRVLPIPGTTVICITSSCPRQFVCPCRLGRCGQQCWFFEPLTPHHHGPCHACNLVGESDSRDLDRPALHEAREPKPLGATLPRIADDRHGTGDQQPSQVSITLFGDSAEALLSTG